MKGKIITKFAQFIKENSTYKMSRQEYADQMLHHYLGCAIWADSDDDIHNMDIEDFDQNEILDKAKKDVDAFLDKTFDKINGVISPEQAGHDFWLTRCHHGAGFWDRGLGELGDELTKISHEFKPVDLEVGDDGYLHFL